MRNPDGLGMNLDRKAFEMYLRQVAEARGVECVWPAHLFSCELHDDRWHCTAKSEDANYSFTSKFVIDATGRSSYFSSKLGIKRKRYDKLISYWAYMSDQEENQMSTISAGRNGWWYTAVIPNKRRVIAYQTDSDLVDRAKIKSLGAFLSLARDNNKITRILERSNGDICFHGAVAANSSRLDKASGNQWAAIGDAAISFDPLSSQGMFHAMASAMQLKELITKHDIISNCNSNYMDNFKKEYNDQIDKIWEHYIQHKDLFYRQERRWMNSTFWKRRHLLLVEEI
jgi:flavin-dependent dehydrogenase